MKRLGSILIAASMSNVYAFALPGGDALSHALRNLSRDIPESNPAPGEARPEQPNPLEPTGFPAPPERDGRLPPPETPTREDQEIQVIRAGMLTREGNVMLASGNIHVRYKGYDIFAEQGAFDLAKETAILVGNVTVIGKTEVITGSRVELDIQNEFFRAWGADSEIRPPRLDNRVLSDVYFGGRQIYGTERRFWGEDATITTCSLDDPHFFLRSRSTDIIPGRRVVLRDTQLVVLGSPLFTVNYLVIPLDDRNFRYTPEIGQSPQEGYFVKTRFASNGPGATWFDNRLDYYTRLFFGAGTRWNYPMDQSLNHVSFYTIPRQSTVEASVNHAQRIGNSTFNFEGTLVKNNVLVARDQTSTNLRSSFALPNFGGETRLSLLYTNTRGRNFFSENQTLGLQDNRRFGPQFTTNLDLNLVSSSSGSGIGGTGIRRRQLDIRFRAVQDVRKAQIDIEYLRSVPIGEIQNFFSGLDRTPMLTVRSDARRLLDGNLPGNINFNTSASIGELFDTQRRRRVVRSAFELDFSRAPQPTRLSIDFNGRFRQAMYSDDTAQYVLGLGTNIRYRLGPDTAANVRYNFSRPYGFSPLSIDQLGRTHVVTGDLSFRPFDSLLLALQTGYDFRQRELGAVPWQSIQLRQEWRPTAWFQLRGLTTYDTFRKGWANTRFDIAWQAGDTFFGLAARYDFQRHTWGNINFLMEGLQTGRLRTSLLLNYNGFSRRFEARHLSLIYDLHCTEAILTILDNPVGFNRGTQIGFFLRLKALPFNTGFGTGTQGQPLGLGTGFGF